MFKSKWYVIVAALALLLIVAGCASQAGSEPSTPEQSSGRAAPTTGAAITESPVATPEVAATETMTATEAITGTTEAAPEAAPAASAGAGDMPAQAKAVQTWPVLWDPEIGFEVRYPQGWLVGEAEVTEQDAPITRVYTLTPANWAEDYAPILVEVSEGSAADFRKAYIEPTQTEARQIGPLTYQYETSGSEGSLEHYAVFTSPDTPDLRVVIRDTVTGFTDRAQAHADLAPLVQQVIESFRWRK